MQKITQLKLICDSKSELGEGPVWDAAKSCLYWVDIIKNTLYIYPAERPEAIETLEISPYISSIVPRRSGGFALTLQDGFYAFDPKSKELTPLAEVEAHLTDNRFNDGKCDPAGRYLAGTMSLNGQTSKGALYSMDTQHSVKLLATDITTSNGLAWSSDGRTMYYIDTPTRQVVAYDYQIDTGGIDNRRAVVSIPSEHGYPDGMTIDSEGMLWVAHWGGWQVSRWNPHTGEQLAVIPVPASQVTSCTFGGPHLDKLFITTARVGLDEHQLANQPLAGGVFCAEVGIKGTASIPYEG